MGGSEDMMRLKRDDVSEWFGVTVLYGRVANLEWAGCGLTGEIPAEFGALSALVYLSLTKNKLKGPIPASLGALKSLSVLSLASTSLTGAVPCALSDLENLRYFGVGSRNALSTTPHIFISPLKAVQDYLLSLWRPATFRFLKYAIAITKMRLDRTDPASPPHPFFVFLVMYEDSITDLVLSYLNTLNSG